MIKSLFPQIDQPTKLITDDIDEAGAKIVENMKAKQE